MKEFNGDTEIIKYTCTYSPWLPSPYSATSPHILTKRTHISKHVSLCKCTWAFNQISVSTCWGNTIVLVFLVSCCCQLHASINDIHKTPQSKLTSQFQNFPYSSTDSTRVWSCVPKPAVFPPKIKLPIKPQQPPVTSPPKRHCDEGMQSCDTRPDPMGSVPVCGSAVGQVLNVPSHVESTYKHQVVKSLGILGWECLINPDLKTSSCQIIGIFWIYLRQPGCQWYRLGWPILDSRNGWGERIPPPSIFSKLFSYLKL